MNCAKLSPQLLGRAARHKYRRPGSGESGPIKAAQSGALVKSDTATMPNRASSARAVYCQEEPSVDRFTRRSIHAPAPSCSWLIDEFEPAL